MKSLKKSIKRVTQKIKLYDKKVHESHDAADEFSDILNSCSIGLSNKDNSDNEFFGRLNLLKDTFIRLQNLYSEPDTFKKIKHNELTLVHVDNLDSYDSTIDLAKLLNTSMFSISDVTLNFEDHVISLVFNKNRQQELMLLTRSNNVFIVNCAIKLLASVFSEGVKLTSLNQLSTCFRCFGIYSTLPQKIYNNIRLHSENCLLLISEQKIYKVELNSYQITNIFDYSKLLGPNVAVVSGFTTVDDSILCFGDNKGRIGFLLLDSFELLYISEVIHPKGTGKIVASHKQNCIYSSGYNDKYLIKHEVDFSHCKKSIVLLKKTDTIYFNEKICTWTLSNNERLVAIALFNNQIALIHTDPFKLYSNMYGHHLTIVDLLFMSNDKQLVSIAADKKMIIWDSSFCTKNNVFSIGSEYIPTCIKLLEPQGVFIMGTDTGEILQIKISDGTIYNTLIGGYAPVRFITCGKNINEMICLTDDCLFLKFLVTKWSSNLEISRELQKDIEYKVISRSDYLINAKQSNYMFLESPSIKSLTTLDTSDYIIRSIDNIDSPSNTPDYVILSISKETYFMKRILAPEVKKLIESLSYLPDSYLTKICYLLNAFLNSLLSQKLNFDKNICLIYFFKLYQITEVFLFIIRLRKTIKSISSDESDQDNNYKSYIKELILNTSSAVYFSRSVCEYLIY